MKLSPGRRGWKPRALASSSLRLALPSGQGIWTGLPSGQGKAVFKVVTWSLSSHGHRADSFVCKEGGQLSHAPQPEMAQGLVWGIGHGCPWVTRGVHGQHSQVGTLGAASTWQQPLSPFLLPVPRPFLLFFLCVVLEVEPLALSLWLETGSH